jgi:hypothetical protein
MGDFPAESDFGRSGPEVWWSDEGQNVGEYEVMLAVILIIIIGTIRLIGGAQMWGVALPAR